MKVGEENCHVSAEYEGPRAHPLCVAAPIVASRTVRKRIKRDVQPPSEHIAAAVCETAVASARRSRGVVECQLARLAL